MGAAVTETNQRFQRLFNVCGLNGLKRMGDGRVGCCRGDRRSNVAEIRLSVLVKLSKAN
jgi:hypothetical protein